MVNQWIEFVRHFARHNDISYSSALKEAGPAYRNMKKKAKSKLIGKGFDDLPDEMQEEIGNYSQNNSLVNIINSNKRTNQNKRIQNEKQRRTTIVQTEFNELRRSASYLLSNYQTELFNSFSRGDDQDVFVSQYYDRVVVVLNNFSKFERNSLQLLSEQQQVSFRELKRRLQYAVDVLNRGVNRENRARNDAPSTRPWYERFSRRRR